MIFVRWCSRKGVLEGFIVCFYFILFVSIQPFTSMYTLVCVYCSDKRKYGVWNIKKPKYVCLRYTCLEKVEVKVCLISFNLHWIKSERHTSQCLLIYTWSILS